MDNKIKICTICNIKPTASNGGTKCRACKRRAKPIKVCKICNKRNATRDSARCIKCKSKGQKYIDKQRQRFNPYRKHLGDKCIKCGFIPEHKCQLDIDHIDGNHSNNDLSNLQTLCANCHRLKTETEKDYRTNAEKASPHPYPFSTLS
jgi:5-methylcytosine-specific restriction endonuclease McrA